MSKDVLKLALEFVNDIRRGKYKGDAEEISTALEQAIAAPVHEPIGYAVPTFDFDNSVIKKVHYAGTVPVYTTPPAQEFVCSTGLCHYKPAAPVQSGLDADCIASVVSQRYTTPPAANPTTEKSSAVQQAPVQKTLSELQKDATNLLFALHDAWPYVHQHCTIESNKKAIQALIVKHGDFADLQPPAAQRPWVGLTDEEIGMCLDVGDGSMSKIIYAIEAKLKELNT